MLMSQVDLTRVMRNDPGKLAPLVAAGSFTTVIAAAAASVQLLLGAAPSTAAAAGGGGGGSWVSALETGADAALSLLTLVTFSRAMEVLLMERDSVLTCVWEERERRLVSFPTRCSCCVGCHWEGRTTAPWNDVASIAVGRIT